MLSRIIYIYSVIYSMLLFGPLAAKIVINLSLVQFSLLLCLLSTCFYSRVPL